jgi:CRP-like cAMP-binding protein
VPIVSTPNPNPEILRPSSQRALARGERLFSNGDRVESMFRVVRGRVRLERCLADGRLVAMRTVGVGELVAEGSLFADRYHCDAVAAIRSVVEVEQRSRVLRRLAAEPGELFQLCRLLGQQLREARLLLEIRTIRPARDRLLTYLETRHATGLAPREGPVRLIADELDLAPETLYRLLAELEQDGEITRIGRSIRLGRPA